jgi:hypothetical protein
MHVQHTRGGARYFKCYEDGASLRESKENRILRPGRPPKGSLRPKRVR